MLSQYGGGACSLCGSPGTNKLSCPLNPIAKKPNLLKHSGVPKTIVHKVKIRPRAHPAKDPSPPKQRSPSPAPPKQRSPSPAAPKRRSPSPAAAAHKPRSPSPSPPKRKSPSPSPPKRKSPSAAAHKPRSASPSPPKRRSPSPLLVQNPPTVSLKHNYLTTKTRTMLKRKFENVIQNKEVFQCISGGLDRYITLTKRIGNGTFGIVHSASSGSGTEKNLFAVKEAKTTREVLKKAWSEKTDWREAIILRDISNPIVEKGICPNVPVMYGAYACDKCEFEGLNSQKKKKNLPCIILLMELASGDLAHWLNTKPSEQEIYCSIFQILAGLYALQKHGQIFNNDIKTPNILYYDVAPGGYWVYNIMGKQYNVPNMGKLFVINDFGVSAAFAPEFQYSFSPETKEYSLGRRIYTVLNKSIVPFSMEGLPVRQMLFDVGLPSIPKVGTTNKKITNNIKVTLSAEQTDLLRRNNLPTDGSDLRFYSNVDIIPPQDIAFDVYDALAMFVGDLPRATQNGVHVDHHIPDNIKHLLSSFLPTKEQLNSGNAADGNMSSYYYRWPTRMNSSLANAGYMIDDLFGKKHPDYLAPQAGAPIEVYNI